MAAARAAFNAFNEKQLVAIDQKEWDVYSARLFRYQFYDSYYHNTVYKQLEAARAIAHKKNAKLYKHIRGIYNPAGRLVDLYVAKIYGGSLDFENAQTGAVPIVADDAVRDALIQLWRWSNWQNGKSLFVRYGAKLGDSFIKVVDEPAKQKVRLEVVHPNKIADAKFDAVGNVKSVRIEYEKVDEGGSGNAWLDAIRRNKTYLYTEIWDGDTEKVYTLRDGEPFAYYTNSLGEPVSEWDNEYGFVPLVHAKHKDMGLTSGANAFHAGLDKIDEINDAASILNDQVRKAVNLIWMFTKAKRADVDASTSDRDTLPAIYMPEGTTATPLIGNIDIAAASANVQHLLTELERDMPELSLHRLRELGSLTAPGVRAGYSDAIDRIDEARGNYDEALVRAQQMALTIGGIGAYRGFEAFNLDSYANGDLEHFIQERAVIKDALSKLEKIQALQQIGGAERLVLKELDYDDDTIDDILNDKKAAEEARTRAAARGFAETIFPADDDETDDDAAAEDEEELEVVVDGEA